MALKCGIVGLPNVGKSTLFNCLSSAKAQAANFPFCTIEPNLGVITVPDERLNKLAEIVHPGRIVPATCEIEDIAGLVKGASKGEGLGNKFLGNIRECDAIIHVVRCFDDDNIVREGGAAVDPLEDKSIIDTELQLKDLETIESQLSKQQKTAAAGNKDAKVMVAVLEAYKEVLEQGKNARAVTFESKEEQKVAHDLFLLTQNIKFHCDLFCFFKIDLLVYRYHNTFQEELFDDRRCLDLHSVSQLFDRHGFRKCDGFDFIFLLLLYRWCRLFYLLLVILSAAAVIILGIIFSSLTQTVALALEFINFILTVVSSTSIVEGGSHDVVLKNATPNIING